MPGMRFAIVDANDRPIVIWDDATLARRALVNAAGEEKHRLRVRHNRKVRAAKAGIEAALDEFHHQLFRH